MKTKQILKTILLFVLVVGYTNISFAQERTRIFTEPTATTGTKWVGELSTSDKSTSLTLKKSFKSESITKKSVFEVEEEQDKIRFSVSGSCRSGKILITIVYPSGDLFKYIEIDPSADIRWSQSIKLTDKKDKYIGKWIIEIKAEEAEGGYTFMISAD